MFGFGKKKEAVPGPVGPRKTKTQGKKKRALRHAGPYTPEQRRQAVEAFQKSGMTAKDFAKTWGTSEASLYNWLKVYQEQGPKALDGASLKQGAKKRGRKGIAAPVKDEITAVKRENPEFGAKSVRNFLFRFRGVKVSKGTVTKTLKEANIPPLPPRSKKKRRKKPKVQRFERALPMQLWQTDITSLSLARHSQKVYLTVFMDDYSRYVVSWQLALQQTKEFVMETLLSGIQRFGKPEEVLTDQGRQYFSWRGKSDFRKLLIKQGIQHVVSRAHHPETVGKCERFWETVKTEFWERVEPQELTEARERISHFIEHYNHFRPHQGLDGMTPADRFFGAEAEVRKALEDTISKNALRLALGDAPRKAVFLIGQIGDQSISLHGEKGKLVLQTPDGMSRRMDYEDFGHVKKDPTANPNEGEEDEDRNENRSESAEGRRGEGSSAEETKSEVPASASAGAAGESALGNGDARAAIEGARSVGGDHGVLAGEDHEAGAGGSTQDVPAPNLATVPAGNLGYGGGVTHPTENPRAERSQEYGPTATEGPRERSEDTEREDRGTREAGLGAGATDLDSSRDAGLQRCENPHGDAGSSSVSGRDEAECQATDQENDESSTDRSSS